MNLNQAILRLAHKKTMMKPVSKKPSNLGLNRPRVLKTHQFATLIFLF